MQRLTSSLFVALLCILTGCTRNVDFHTAATIAAEKPAASPPSRGASNDPVAKDAPPPHKDSPDPSDDALPKIGDLPPFADSANLATVYLLIKKMHITTDATEKELYYGAIRGMVEALHDPFTAYLDPKQAKTSREQQAGNFVGVGMTLLEKEGRPTIGKPLPNSPALKAGLRAGDIIVEVDGKSTQDMALDDAVSHIRGPSGTQVTLKLFRPGSNKPFDVTLTRAKIVTPSVKWEIKRAGGKKLMVVTVESFGDDTRDLFVNATKEALLQQVDGFVLDLRDNGGGLLSMAGYISCAWVTNKPFVTLGGRKDGKQAVMTCGSYAPLADMPTVVLVNGYSASASEITAGALQDTHKARIIGEKTFGKGCGQDVIDFPDGSQLRLVTFLWFTTSGRTIHKVGITPDETLKADPDDLAKGKDVQMERAVQYLTAGH